jgi:hypothetical protein
LRRLALPALIAGLAYWLLSPSAPQPPLLAGLSDDGLRGAPCPVRSLYEQDARRKHGAQAPSALGERLRQQFPLGSSAAKLRDRLTSEGFAAFTPCANDEEVLGARWLTPRWGAPDAYVYWRADDDRLTFLDGHVSRTN